MRYLHVLLPCLCLLATSTTATGQEKIADALARIHAVGAEGKGNVEAAKAWKTLVGNDAAAIIDILAGLDEANPVSANWIRSAVDAIAERTLTAGKRLPADRLEEFVKNTKNQGAARKLAYDWLARVDTSAPDRLLPGMLNDPGTGLRREAVAVLVTKAEEKLEKDKAGATAGFQKVLEHARDADQVNKAAAELKKLGVEVDLTKQFGFLTRWRLVGPFDNGKGIGFAASYPPEKSTKASATFESKDKDKIGWKGHTTDMPMGLVDLNKVFGRLKGAVAYGYTAVESPQEQPVEIRVGSYNAVRIYLNGKEIYHREEYHHGMTMDQHVGKGILQKGANEILIKVCQNEQTDSWAQNWSFQLRVCDRLGTPVSLTVVDPKK